MTYKQFETSIQETNEASEVIHLHGANYLIHTRAMEGHHGIITYESSIVLSMWQNDKEVWAFESKSIRSNYAAIQRQKTKMAYEFAMEFDKNFMADYNELRKELWEECKQSLCQIEFDIDEVDASFDIEHGNFNGTHKATELRVNSAKYGDLELLNHFDEDEIVELYRLC